MIGNTTEVEGNESEFYQGNPATYKEAVCLHGVNENETSVRKEILTHPLVRFFVDRKFRKLLYFIWASIALKVRN